MPCNFYHSELPISFDGRALCCPWQQATPQGLFTPRLLKDYGCLQILKTPIHCVGVLHGLEDAKYLRKSASDMYTHTHTSVITQTGTHLVHLNPDCCSLLCSASTSPHDVSSCLSSFCNLFFHPLLHREQSGSFYHIHSALSTSKGWRGRQQVTALSCPPCSILKVITLWRSALWSVRVCGSSCGVRHRSNVESLSFLDSVTRTVWWKAPPQYLSDGVNVPA